MSAQETALARFVRLLQITRDEAAHWRAVGARIRSIAQLIDDGLTARADGAHTSGTSIGTTEDANRLEPAMDAPSILDLTDRFTQALEPALRADAARVSHYLERSRASSTMKAHESRWRLVGSFCARVEVPALPLSVPAACVLFARMADAGYSAKYIRQVASTIVVAHHLAGEPSPLADPAPRRMLAGIGRELGYDSPNAKAAIFSDQLAALAPRMLAHGLKGEQEWTILVTGWNTIFRRANIVALDLGDLVFYPSLEAATHVEVTARRSKTDQYGHGHQIMLAALPNDELFCPVRWLRGWVLRLHAAGYTTGPLFRHFSSATRISAKRICEHTVGRILKKYVGDLSLDAGRYGAQSLRAGFMTQALLSGIDEARVAERSNHRDSDSVRKYFRPGLRDAALTQEVLHERNDPRLSAGTSGASQLILKTPGPLPRVGRTSEN